MLNDLNPLISQSHFEDKASKHSGEYYDHSAHCLKSKYYNLNQIPALTVAGRRGMIPPRACVAIVNADGPLQATPPPWGVVAQSEAARDANCSSFTSR
jgi:hypothetical protein